MGPAGSAFVENKNAILRLKNSNNYQGKIWLYLAYTEITIF
jgi:hypothetical protein